MVSMRPSTTESYEVPARLFQQTVFEHGDVTQKLSSGYKAEHYMDEPEGASIVLQSRFALSRMEHRVESNKLLGYSLGQSSQLLSQMNGILDEFRVSCTAANNNFGLFNSKDAFKNHAKMLGEQFINLLNSKDQNGRYLFSGTVTNTPPVDISKYPSALPTPSTLPDPTGAAAADRATIQAFLDVPHTEYYQGNTRGLQYNTADGHPLLELPVNALSPGFEMALRSFEGAKYVEDRDLKVLQKVSELVATAQKELNEGPSMVVGMISKNIERLGASFEKHIVQLKDIFGEAAEADAIKYISDFLSCQNKIRLVLEELVQVSSVDRELTGLLKR